MNVEQELPTQGTQEVRVVHVSQRRLDIRRVIAAGAAIILIILAIRWRRIDPRSLRVVVSIVLGAALGVVIGYIRAPRPDYFVEIDTTKLRNSVDIRIVPKNVRSPRQPSIAIGSTGGSTVYFVTSEELSQLGLTELNVRRDELRSLARRIVRLEKTIAERLADVEIESLRYARQLFERYLRLRRKLAEEAVERPRREVSEE